MSVSVVRPEEIHLEKLQLVQAVHVVLGDNFLAVGAVERDELLAAVAGEITTPAACTEELRAKPSRRAPRRELPARADPVSRELAEARLGFDRVLELDVQDVGHQLGDALDVGEAHVEHAAYVLDGGARGQGVEGDDLRHLLAAVFFGDVLNHFAAPVHAEIDIDIGHADALRIQEALKQQAVLQRIDIRDLHRVADEASRGRSAARPDRNVLRFREADEIPDDQEVAGELHLLDHLDFAVEALHILGKFVLEFARGVQGFQAHAALFETLPGDVGEVGIGGVRRPEYRSAGRGL